MSASGNENADESGDRRRLTELDGDDADALAERVRETEYVARLEAYLEDEHDVAVPTENVRAFERADGVRAVTFESEATVGDRPAVAVTVHVDGPEAGVESESAAAVEESIVRATAERHGPDVDGTVALHFPTELAPDPEAAVRDLLEARGQSVAVTVDESDDVTTYTIEA